MLFFSSHFRFRECLLDQTQRTCNKEAYPFAQQILDKAMGFLQDQCSSYTYGIFQYNDRYVPKGSEFLTADLSTSIISDLIKSTVPEPISILEVETK